MVSHNDMPRYPHTKLFWHHHPHRTVLITGPHIQILDTHGHVHRSTAHLAQEDQDAVVQSGPIRCSSISLDARYLATTGDDKQLKIWDLDSLTLSSSRALPKKPTSITFSTNMDVLVADKFGDVFRYPLHPNGAPMQEKSANDPLASHENPSNGELVLGHASLLTNCLLTADEKFVITADRDEHIRVSWYPEGYVIESYCLGHTKYVSAIHIPAVSPAYLISGGGDPDLKVWDWMTGRLQRNISVFAAVEPFIKVRPKARRHASSGEHDDDDEVGTSKRGKKYTGKTKRRNVGSLEPEDHTPFEDTTNITHTMTPVLVVCRIDSFLSEGRHHIVFSAVGATAIFEFVLADTDVQPDIRYRDFGKPVIDFTLCEDGTVLVLLDADFPEPEGSDDMTDERPHELVYAVRWSVDQFIDDDRFSALLDSINTARMLPATIKDLEALDLYSNLTALPKSIDAEFGSHVPEIDQPSKTDTVSTSMHTPDSEPVPSDAAGGLTKRALGRLKHKRALDLLCQQTMTEDEHETKKVKADGS